MFGLGILSLTNTVISDRKFEMLGTITVTLMSVEDTMQSIRASIIKGLHNQ